MTELGMTREQRYAFDVAGYLIVPNALDAVELVGLERAIQAAGSTESLLHPSPFFRPFRDLMIHARLVRCANELCGWGFRLDSEPRLLDAKFARAGDAWQGGNEPWDASRAYDPTCVCSPCQSLLAIWALSPIRAGDGGLVLVPGSHKSNLEAPIGARADEDDLGVGRQPVLAAGDLLLMTGNLLRGMRPWRGAGPLRLLSYAYAARSAYQAPATSPEVRARPTPWPAWANRYPAEQRVVLQQAGYPGAQTPPGMVSDDRTRRFEDLPTPVHPSIYVANPHSGIDERELYLWDLRGYIVARGVMSAGDLQRANAAIDRFADRVRLGEDLGGSPALAGTGRPEMSGLLGLPPPWDEPFRDMIAHSAITARLDWMMGSGYRANGASAWLHERGSAGTRLHGGPRVAGNPHRYVFRNGRSYVVGSPAIGVAWQLRDTDAGDGGFVCVPGSHKASFDPPERLRTAELELGLLEQPAMKAGDVLFFMDGGLTHGALPWKSERARRVVVVKYSSPGFSWGNVLVEPRERWGPLAEEMSEEQLVVLRGPSVDLGDENDPRLVVRHGRVRVERRARPGSGSGSS